MITKKISPKGKSVRVTFSLPQDVAEKSVAVVGDFNGWDAKKGLMKLKKKDGVWTKGVSVKPGESLEFRYLADGSTWLNDEQADQQVPNEYFGTNCVVVAPEA
jgi:1,4-alpha-glucan branching enzyme